MKIEGIKLLPEFKGARVIYVPRHAKGETSHPDCESGTISSWNDYFVFVVYRHGISKATNPRDLKWEEIPRKAEWISSCCGAATNSSLMEKGLCPYCKDHCSYEKMNYDGEVIETLDV